MSPFPCLLLILYTRKSFCGCVTGPLEAIFSSSHGKRLNDVYSIIGTDEAYMLQSTETQVTKAGSGVCGYTNLHMTKDMIVVHSLQPRAAEPRGLGGL